MNTLILHPLAALSTLTKTACADPTCLRSQAPNNTPTTIQVLGFVGGK